MRIAVTGGDGMLALALVPELRARGHEVRPYTRAELDVTDASAAVAALGSFQPEVVIQCAAFTAVDDAERQRDLAMKVNAGGTENIAKVCHDLAALLVYPSSDYVFRGDGTRPYRPDDPVDPINEYGRSKAAGEDAARAAGRWIVVRTSWLYGAGGPNFVDTMSRLARERESLDVVDDQVGRPTWTGTLATTMAALIESGAKGTLHATDSGDPVTWYGFAREILRLGGSPTPVRPMDSATFPRPAARPGYSVLDCAETERIIGRPLPTWRDALTRYLATSSVPV
jgi:dTDP-4-dehydrorhamnose reductase